MRASGRDPPCSESGGALMDLGGKKNLSSAKTSVQSLLEQTSANMQGLTTMVGNRNYHPAMNVSILDVTPDIEKPIVLALQGYALAHNGYCPDTDLPGAKLSALDPSYTYGFGCAHPEVNCACPMPGGSGPSFLFDCNPFPMPLMGKFGYCRIAVWVWIVGGLLIVMMLACGGYCMVHKSSSTPDDEQ